MKVSKLKNKILSLFLLCELCCFIFIFYNHELVSDYLGMPTHLDMLTIASIFIILISFYFIFHFLWVYSEKIFRTNLSIGSVGDLNYFILLLIILYFIFNLKTGVGKVGGESSVSLSDIDKLLFIAPVIFKLNFLIYIYAAGNKNKNFLYYINLIFFSLVELNRGVSFTILLLLIIEFDKVRKFISIRYFVFSLIFSVLLVNVIYNIKFYVRMGEGYEYINIYTSMIMLMGRLSILSNLIFIYENITNIQSYFNVSQYQGIGNEFLESLTPVPSLFGINEKMIEFGKVLFSYSHVTFNSATAASLLGVVYVYPDSIISIFIVIIVSWVYIHILTAFLEFSKMQRTVAYFFVLLALYQGFVAILSNYIYALTIYFIIACIRNILLSGKHEKI